MIKTDVFNEKFLKQLVETNHHIEAYYTNETTTLLVQYENKGGDVFEVEPCTEKCNYLGLYNFDLKNNIILNGNEYHLTSIENYFK